MNAIEAVARAAHEINRAYCELLGDTSQPVWEEAPGWQIDSAIQGVQYVLENPDASPENQHKNWMDIKLANGWIYGEVKDAQAHTHPCLKPWAELPLEQRAKDVLFRAVVRQFMRQVPT
jgi:hypothetical protein